MISDEELERLRAWRARFDAHGRCRTCTRPDFTGPVRLCGNCNGRAVFDLDGVPDGWDKVRPVAHSDVTDRLLLAERALADMAEEGGARADALRYRKVLERIASDLHEHHPEGLTRSGMRSVARKALKEPQHAA